MTTPSRRRAAAPPIGITIGTRLRRRLGTLGLTAALVSTSACTWMWLGPWPAAAAGGGAVAGVGVDAGPLSWLRVGVFSLALAGPIGLVGFVVALARRESAMAFDARRRQSLHRRALLDLLNLLPVAVAVSSTREARVAPNRAMTHMLGIDEGEATPHAVDWQQIVVAEDWPAWVGATESALRAGRARWLRCKMQLAGTAREVLAHVAPIDGEDGVELVISLALPQGEAGLAQSAVLQLRDLLELVEAEKWHFGQAVHDELGQRLSGIAYFAKALQFKLQKAQRIEADDAGWLTRLSNESMSVARGLARGLVPVGSDDPGALGVALAELCERAGRTFNIGCTLKVDPGFDPGGAAKANHLYHATQELVTNAVKHGRARRVQVSLEVLVDRQRVTVRNDGIGLGESPARRGMGVNGVRSRVAYLGGQFTLADESRGGVLAAIDLPAPAGPTDMSQRMTAADGRVAIRHRDRG
jgi:signal transduction histidine kinase